METYYFVEELPLALEYGMTPHQFWDEDADLFYAYQQAYINKLHKQAHVQATYNSLATYLGIANAFREKGAEYIQYPKEEVFNPFAKIEEKEKSYINTIDTSINNNGLYKIKRNFYQERSD